MQTYLVGGAVRDLIMGVHSQDADYVVVGATHDEMIANSFSKVGADFPVYICQLTGDEYALARTERKSGSGYLGFEVDASETVTLEDDLSRRDLTINSIALADGVYFDPFNGKSDIEKKIFRHTSSAFADDPVRVLRIARFAARFGGGWTVAQETKELIYAMAKNGVLAELTPERIWKELSRALMEDTPRAFFDTLRDLDVLHILFPEVYALLSSTEAIRWHPEGNSYEHTMLVLQQSAILKSDLVVRYAALVHDFGKGLTPKDKLPRHFGHDVFGVKVSDSFSDRLKVPAHLKYFGAKFTRYHMSMHKLGEITAKTYVKMFDDIKRDYIDQFLDVMLDGGLCDQRGRLGYENTSVENIGKLTDAARAYRSVKFEEVFPNGAKNPEAIKNGLYRARIAAINKVI